MRLAHHYASYAMWSFICCYKTSTCLPPRFVKCGGNILHDFAAPDGNPGRAAPRTPRRQMETKEASMTTGLYTYNMEPMKPRRPMETNEAKNNRKEPQTPWTYPADQKKTEMTQQARQWQLWGTPTPSLAKQHRGSHADHWKPIESQ